MAVELLGLLGPDRDDSFPGEGLVAEMNVLRK